MKEGRKPEYPEKTPGDELQKMPHVRRFKPQARHCRLESRHANRYTTRRSHVCLKAIAKGLLVGIATPSSSACVSVILELLLTLMLGDCWLVA